MLKATKRKPGTRQAKKLRLQGLIPASIQGEGRPNADVSIDERAFMTARRHHEHLFEIEVESGDTETVLVHQLQWETTVERIQHVEFRRVVLGRKTEVEVELIFTGHPKGGVTNHLVTQITLLALPSEIPDGIGVPMEEHEPGHTVYARDLVLPSGVELVDDPDMAIAVVAVPRGVDEDTPAEEEAGPASTPPVPAPE
jgi:large subunit ribosomal protein L25